MSLVPFDLMRSRSRGPEKRFAGKVAGTAVEGRGGRRQPVRLQVRERMRHDVSMVGVTGAARIAAGAAARFPKE